LNNIEKVKVRFTGGDVNGNTIIHIELDEEMPFVDMLKTLPEVADVSIINNDIQLTLKPK
jgi:hypothetical protein